MSTVDLQLIRGLLAAQIVAVAALALGCELGAYRVEVARSRPDADGGSADGAQEPVEPWGSYAASLNLPLCPEDNAVLVVDALDTGNDGGEDILDPAEAGPALGLIEAFFIAANRGTPHTISFDPAVFPVDRPGVIQLPPAPIFPYAWIDDLCVDGRGRGVVLSWDPGVLDCGRCAPLLGDRNLVVGLELRDLTTKLNIRRSQVAGCRVVTAETPFVLGPAATLGPGNVILPGTWGLRVDHLAAGVKISGNDFGYDPLTRQVGCTAGMVLFDGVEVEDNVFACQSPIDASIDPWMLLQVRNNYFGVGRDLQPLDLQGFAPSGLRISSGSWRIEGNVMRGLVSQAVWSFVYPSVGSIDITRNSISANRGGIEYYGGEPPVPAPVITAASIRGVAGECAVAGRVEVFSDPGDQGEIFLGEAPCEAGAAWQLEAEVPAGRNVTATLTDATPFTSAFSAPVPVNGP